MQGFFTQMLSGMSGEPSTMRVLTMVIVLAIMIPWAVISIRTNTLQPLSYEQIGLVLGALGLKAWQRGKEATPPTTPEQPPTPKP